MDYKPTETTKKTKINTLQNKSKKEEKVNYRTKRGSKMWEERDKKLGSGRNKQQSQKEA